MIQLFGNNYSFNLFVHRSSLVQCLDRYPSAVSHAGDPPPIPYTAWGPSICRWLATKSLLTRWITTTSGQRCIIMPDPSFHPENTYLILLNFSQNDVAKLRVAEELKDERNRRDCHTRGYDEGSWRETFDDSDSDDSDGMDGLSKPIGQVRINRRTQRFWNRNQCFQDKVHSNLPFTIYSSKKRYNFQGVMLDEERILGLGVRMSFVGHFRLLIWTD